MADSNDYTDSYNTPLPREEKASFDGWVQDQSEKLGRDVRREMKDYDLQGFWRANVGDTEEGPQLGQGHLTDAFKKPNHPTFSSESIYHGIAGHEGGTWEKISDADGVEAWQFKPGATNLEHHTPERLRSYFDKVEPGNKVVLPGDGDWGSPGQVDRSRIRSELEAKPWLADRLRQMVRGEVGPSASPEVRRIQMESAMNRALERGHSLEQALWDTGGHGSRGYYPPQTFTRGGHDRATFDEDLETVLAGSNYGGKYGKGLITGNASGSVAANQFRKGTHGFTLETGSGPESYFREGPFGGVNVADKGYVPDPGAASAQQAAEVAAARTRRSVRPEGGREEGVGTDVATGFIPAALRTAGGVAAAPIRAIGRLSEQMGRAAAGEDISENPQAIPHVVGDVFDVIGAGRGGGATLGSGVVIPQAAMRQAGEEALGTGAGSVAKSLFGKYRQHTEQYPDVPPPVLSDRATGKPIANPPKSAKAQQAMVDDGKAYWGKGSTPELDTFMKDRTKLNKEMDKEGYPRFFNLAERADVDPANYPTGEPMVTAAQPKKAATREQYAAEYNTPEARARLQKGYEEGATIADADRWYFVKQIEDQYVKYLGPEEGRRRFAQEFAGGMAATTGGSEPTANFLMSAYANFLQQRGMEFPTNAYQMPNPIGGRYAGQNMQIAEAFYKDPTARFGAENPKRSDFQHAFLGHKEKATIDEQMMSAIKPGEQQPKWYGPATQVAIDIAKANGVDPRGFQDVTWAGIKKQAVEARGKTFEYEGPMIEHVNRSLYRTAVLTGQTQEQVMKNWVTKGNPMYSIAPILAAGGAIGAEMARQQQAPEPAAATRH